MAIDPEVIISAALARADEFSGAASAALGQINTSTGIQGAINSPNVNPVIQPYSPPSRDSTPTPVYEPPITALPVAPELADVATIAKPVFPGAPTLATSGLFTQVAPSANIPSWNEAEPDLRVDALVAEMDSLLLPVLRQFDFPDITPLAIADAPTLTLPGYDAPVAPDAIRDPNNYAAEMEARYNAALPEIQAFIDDKVSTWIATYAPEYQSHLSQLAAKITSGMDATVLPDQIEAAMYTRARGRIEQEFHAAEQGLLETYSKRGFYEPPGALLAGLRAGRMKGAEALANTSTDIYIERRKTEVQHLQFIMNLASSQIQSVRSLAVQYAGIIGNSVSQAISYSNQVGEMSIKVYEHLASKANLAIAVMNALGNQYEIRLKAALSALDGYKLQLEAEKAKKDVEIAQLSVIEAQIKTQELEISRYSAVIEAIGRKANVEELKLKGYTTRADVFKTQIQSQVAGFDVYKAALAGDQSKLDGELSKLKIYESQLKAIELELEANIKSTESTIATNDAKIKVFENHADVYKLDLESALKRFAALVEVKKLGQAIYGTEVDAAVRVFEGHLQVPKILADAVLREYEGRVRAAESATRVTVERAKIAQTGSIAIADGFCSIAAASIGSTNSVVSAASTSSE
ncbi:MAG: hypothetical protein PHW53_05140 [Patescibacteria group bacterium]|nr:hypothetical protein [Patescibacteria group bacterium]